MNELRLHHCLWTEFQLFYFRSWSIIYSCGMESSEGKDDQRLNIMEGFITRSLGVSEGAVKAWRSDDDSPRCM